MKFFSFLKFLLPSRPCLWTSAIALIVGLSGGADAAGKIVGISVPLSGKASALGRQYVAGLRFALETLPQTDDIELVISDDGCDRELAELAIDDIQNAGAVLITGFLCNEPVYTALEKISDPSLPLLVTGARSNRILKDRKRRGWNVWQSAPRDSDVALAAFNALSKRWRNTAYAIVDDGTIFGRTQADEFRALMEESGNKPQFIDNFRPSQSTQAGLIRRLKKSGVEAVYLAAGADDVALIGRNMIEFGFTIEIATGEAVALLPYIEDNKGIPTGMLALMPAPPEELPRLQNLLPELQARKLEPEPYLLLGYSTMQIIAQYLKQPEPHFANATFSTITGAVEFNENGRNIVSQYHLYRWDGHSFLKLEGD